MLDDDDHVTDGPWLFMDDEMIASEVRRLWNAAKRLREIGPLGRAIVLDGEVREHEAGDLEGENGSNESSVARSYPRRTSQVRVQNSTYRLIACLACKAGYLRPGANLRDDAKAIEGDMKALGFTLGWTTIEERLKGAQDQLDQNRSL